MPPKKTIEQTYVKHTPIQAILARPDTFIGSDQKTTDTLYVYDESTETMVEKELTYTPGFIKIFDEVLSNAVDHSTEDPTLKKIEVLVDKESGVIQVSNDGKGIPVVIHKEHNKYVPELIFGELNTSSNYDDTEKRVKAGRNGVGVKLANIFSKKFLVETVDQDNGLKFAQVYSNNMSETGACSVTKCKTKGKTTIKFLPDYVRFGMKGLEQDAYLLLCKRVYDAVPCTNSTVSIYLNGVKIKAKNFEGYIKMFPNCTNVILENEEEPPFSWEVGIGKSNDGFKQVSFVNGVCTTKGGTHVNYITNQFVKKFTEFVQKKKKIENVKAQTIKDNLYIFVKLVTENPKFNTQTKEELVSNSKDFSIKYKLSDAFIEKVYKKNIELVADIVDLTKYKNTKELSKNDGSSTKRQVYLNIPKLDDAHYAGTTKGSSKCTLILVEGDSAKQFAIQGVTTIPDGRKYFGIFPLKGKVMNVQKTTESKLAQNQEINNIMKIMGLQYNKKYTDTSSLRYGSILILTDADDDGTHIKGLIMNLFKTWWPELYSKKGFLTSLNTPIIKVTNGKTNSLVQEFYSQYDYETWSKTNKPSQGYNVKYYKGLGSSTNDEVKSIFKNFARNKVEYFTDKNSDAALDLAFNDKLADQRKEWLKNYKKNEVLEFKANEISCTEFINKGLIHFSMSDNIRSIPGIDGLKPSQRKIMHTMFNKAYSKEMKVSNLSGKVAEYTEYHHGDASLQAAIVSLAQNFIGTNNYNLLEPMGQLGTRATGKAAQSRYIFVKLSEYAKRLFHPDDFSVLKYLENEGTKIEPEYYVPLVPMSLLNGSQGIGTGYSTTLPPFKYSDLVENIKDYLNGKSVEQLQDLVPWYRHYKGEIEALDNNKYILNGNYEIIDDKTLKITELPPGVLTDPYKDDVLRAKLIDKEQIVKQFQENSTAENVSIYVEFHDNILKGMSHEEILKLLKLYKQISCNNFYLFDKDYKIKHYKDANEILADFVDIRLVYYTKRKRYLLAHYAAKELELSNKIRFLNEIMTEKLVIFKKSGKEIDGILERNDYEKLSGNYGYLKDMPIDSFTKEKIEKLTGTYKEIKGKIDYLNSKNEKQLYLIDLAELDNFMAKD